MKRPDLLKAVTAARYRGGGFRLASPNQPATRVSHQFVTCGSLKAIRSCLRHVSAPATEYKTPLISHDCPIPPVVQTRRR